MRKERTNTRTMHYRLALPLIIAYFAGLVLLSGSRSDAAPVASEENRRSTGRESSSRGASNEEKAFPWRAVPVILTPTTNNRRRGLGSETPAEATAPTSNVDVGSTNSTGETDTETAMGGAFGVLGDWRDSVSLPEGGEGGKLGLRGEACLEPGKQEEVREIFRRRRETPAGEKVAACVRTKDAGRFLPEWIAYHQAIGVDELTLYDDDSVDETKKIIQPFVDAGLVMYLFKEVGKRRYQMQPLNHCLKRHMERRAVDSSAPVWVLFHDVDEYMFPVQTNLTMSQALMRHPTTCCVQVPRVQYGTSGLQQQPRGLLLETFLKHAHPGVFTNNRYPKVAVNLEPTDPSLGLIKPPLFNMHDAEGCTCEKIDVTDMRINHYLGSAEDYLQKTKRFWQENHNREKVEENLKTRDINAETSDTITTWACATRETLFRVVNGIDLELGLDRQTTEQRAL